MAHKSRRLCLNRDGHCCIVLWSERRLFFLCSTTQKRMAFDGWRIEMFEDGVLRRSAFLARMQFQSWPTWIPEHLFLYFSGRSSRLCLMPGSFIMQEVEILSDKLVAFRLTVYWSWFQAQQFHDFTLKINS